MPYLPHRFVENASTTTRRLDNIGELLQGMDTMSTQKTLLREIEAFLRETGMAESRFGENAISDRMLVGDLRKGRDVRSGTLDRIRAYMDQMRSGRPAKRKRRIKRPSSAVALATA